MLEEEEPRTRKATDTRTHDHEVVEHAGIGLLDRAPVFPARPRKIVRNPEGARMAAAGASLCRGICIGTGRGRAGQHCARNSHRSTVDEVAPADLAAHTKCLVSQSHRLAALSLP
jgi:hypothetical protein